MGNKTTIVYKEEENKTYITSNVPNDMLNILNKYPEESLEFIESELLKNLLKIMKRYNILVSTDKAIITNKKIEDLECFEIETIVFKEG